MKPSTTPPNRTMHDYLRELPESAIVLDLGSSLGSLRGHFYNFSTVLVDIEPPKLAGNAQFFPVKADMACLPIRNGSTDAVICNHSLEHVVDLDKALGEIGRVLKKQAFLFVSVPDAATLCDRLYRWLARGGGHVNAFTDAGDLIARIERQTGLTHSGTRPLFASFSYLNRYNKRDKAPRKMLLLAGGNERFLLAGTGLLRLLDRVLSTQLTRYGWALYFGRGRPCSERTSIMAEGWRNVCVRCGDGHPAADLLSSNCVGKRVFGVRTYHCPACGALNFFSKD